MGSARSEVWFHSYGRREARNLIVPGVSPSLFGMSAHRSVHSQVSFAMASENGKGSRDVPCSERSLPPPVSRGPHV